MVSNWAEELVRFDREHIIHPVCKVGENSGRIYEKAQGLKLWDTEGNEYIDVASQLASCNLGHGRKEIIEAIQKTVEKLQHISSYFGYNNVFNIECARKLAQFVPKGLDHFLFTSGGGETTDAAFRIARRYWNVKGMPTKSKIISLYGSYHGIVSGSLSATGILVFRTGYGPLMPDFLHLPAYNCYRCFFGVEYPDCDITCARMLGKIIEREGPENIAAFIAEPMLGAGGFIVPPPEYWPLIRETCTKYNVLLIADEVMTGFCRTGKMFGMEHWKVKPDMMTMAKGITSGYLPFGAVAINDEIFEGLKGSIFTHGYTYTGSPVPSAAAIAAMEIYVKEKIADNVAKVSKHITERIEAEFMPLPYVGTYSGLGFMIAIEIVADKAKKAMFDPPSAFLPPLLKRLGEKGLHMREAAINRVAICPPCVTTIEMADKILDILKPAIADIKPPKQ